MTFACYKCREEFENIPNIFKHLKTVHNLNKNKEKIKCVMKNSCSKSFMSFDSLRKHLKICEENDIEQIEDISFNENIFSVDPSMSPSEPTNNFEYVFHKNENIENGTCEFTHDFKIKSKRHMLYENLRSFIGAWTNSVNSMKINIKEKVKVFDLVGELIETLNEINIEIFRDLTTDTAPAHALLTTNNLVHSEISLYETAYKYNKKISSSSTYVHPIEKAIGNRFEMKRCPKSNVAVPRLIQSTFQFIPITKTVKSLFSNEEFRMMYLEHNSDQNHVCTEGIYRYFCCGSVYQNSELFKNDRYTLQIQLYTDDFEICNPLQSKAGVHKLCAVYFQIKNLPIKVQSKLNNIFLVCLCHSNDVNKTTQSDYNNIWEVVVKDIQHLETEGIDIGPMRIRGAVCWPSFDNLGANISLGFAGGFNATYYCRFCECSSMECKTITEEMSSKIRTREKYASCVKKIELLEKVDYRVTLGVKRYCMLNELTYFHITENSSVDILHDVYEGAIPFVLKLVINFMISLKMVKKTEIVEMVEHFDYGELNRMNRPSILALEKTNLGQNGSQSKCLFQHFPFICAKMKSNEELRAVWKNVETLARISQIIHSTVIDRDNLNELEEAVSHLLLSIQTDFSAHLIPKLHNLLHYARIVRSMGPVVYMNTIRYESKHKVLKEIVNQSPNFENICKTIALRHQQNISLSDFGLKDAIKAGSKSLLNVQDCEEDGFLTDILHNNCLVQIINFLHVNNYKYKKGFFILHTANEHKFQFQILLLFKWS